nr:MAG TPA: hypothetical protein [Caudoviricetes sp.]
MMGSISNTLQCTLMATLNRIITSHRPLLLTAGLVLPNGCR